MVFCIFGGYQNCVQQEGGGRKKSELLTGSSDGGIVLDEALTHSFKEPNSQITWNYRYDDAVDVLSITVLNSNITPDDGFSLSMTLSDLEMNNCQANAVLGKNSFQSTVELIVLACLDPNSGRIYLSSQSRSPAGSGNWSSPLAHGLICYRQPCPASDKGLGFQDTQGTNWTHFFTREDNGAFEIVTTRFAKNHNPHFAFYKNNDLRHGNNYLEYLRVTEVDSGDVYDFYFEYLLNESAESIAISHKRELIDSSTQDVIPGNMTAPFPHGVIDL